MKKPPFPWLRRIAPELIELDTIPLFGNAPPFDWHRFSSLIASHFGVKELSIHPGEQMWRGENEWKKGLGPNLMVLPISVSPIQGQLFWIMSRKDIAKITSWMVNGKARSQSLSSELLQEGFFRYLLLEVLDGIQGMPPLQGLTLQLNEEDASPETTVFCIDIETVFDHNSCWGRLAISPEFKNSWVEHFKKNPTESIPVELARQTMLNVGVQVGSVSLLPKEWKKIEKGDFIVLDKGSYDARKEMGTATFMLGSTPLFNVRIKHNKIEFLDYAFYYEENMEQKAHGAPGTPGTPGNGHKHHPPHPHHEKPAEAVAPAEEDVISLKELPLFVSVELARLKISLEQLMSLSPGNLMELPIHPDQSVSLIVNGQLVGRAELVHLGETLGLRIIEIG